MFAIQLNLLSISYTNESFEGNQMRRKCISSSAALQLVTKNPVGDISGTKRATGVPLVSKRLDF